MRRVGDVDMLEAGRDSGRRGETAGHYLSAGVPRASPDQTAAQVLQLLLERQHGYDCVDIICVLDEDDRLLGVITLADLLALPRDARMADSARARYPKVRADTDQERVASLALHHAVSAIPVVDVKGRLLGIVPPPALLAILRREHVEDIHRFAGITRETQLAREAIEAPPLRRLRHRLPCLLLGLLGSVLATFIVARVDTVL